MKKFIINSLSVFILVIIIFFLVIALKNANNILESGYKDMPFNNISNSVSFNAKMDNIAQTKQLENCTFLISGSSMSLNNISGVAIQSKMNEQVYNISAWGLKPNYTRNLLKIMHVPHLKYLLIAFNNIDFGRNWFPVNYKYADTYLNGDNITRNRSLLSDFNIQSFTYDWTYRTTYSHTSNNYQSLCFDETGTVLLDNNNFKIDDKRWNKHYPDTIGFKKFLSEVSQIETFCKSKNIKLILVYLPSRPGLLTDNNILHNTAVANVLHSKFGKSFINLQHLNIPLNQFCDGIHMFKQGAESVTSVVLDSIATTK